MNNTIHFGIKDCVINTEFKHINYLKNYILHAKDRSE